jgi:hypothetical protein
MLGNINIADLTLTTVFYIYMICIFIYALIYYYLGSDHFEGIGQYDTIDSFYLSIDIMSLCGSSNIKAKTKTAKVFVISQQLIIIFLTICVVTNVK